ncbi:MAG: elongation factor Ts [Candidatus Zambryskibacteria bacterium]|nr:elongation factor Ts [Candidatus Zambryskibacteria bacterium]
MITTEQIKELREKTSLSIMQCQKALEEANGDEILAIKLLKEKGAEIASRKSGRTLGAGVVSSYIHTGDSVGTMVELFCETDFVAKNPEFKNTAREIAMHIAAMKPADVGELLQQPYIKGNGETVGDLINGTIQKFGERTEVGQFIRYSIN